jgi:hypothetical protein
MTSEQISYDFGEHPRYMDDFIRGLLKLMIISKINSPTDTDRTKEYFKTFVKQIDECEPYVVNYSRQTLYARFKTMEFTEQKVSSSFVRRNDVMIDVTIESVSEESVKMFDKLAINPEKILWGATGDQKVLPHPLFSLFNIFIESIIKLSRLEPSRDDSLCQKRISIRNVTITSRSTTFELIVCNKLIMIRVIPSRKKKSSVDILFSESKISDSMLALMSQTLS